MTGQGPATEVGCAAVTTIENVPSSKVGMLKISNFENILRLSREWLQFELAPSACTLT